jgi:1,4-dihydroxy-2-naphthoate octaprenyltransferase
VRIGDRRTRTLYVGLIALAAATTIALAPVSTWLLLLSLPAFALAVRPIRAIRAGAIGRDLIGVLAQTGLLVLTYGLSVTALLIVSLVLRSG